MPRRSRGHWNKTNIDITFDEQEKRLDRIPTSAEFNCGALSAIRHGRYDPNIKTWNWYLRHRGKNILREKGICIWTPKNFNEVYDLLSYKLGRTPKYRDFIDAGYRGAIIALGRGKIFGEQLRTYNEYLKYRGKKPIHEPNKWATSSSDQIERFVEEHWKGFTISAFRNSPGAGGLYSVLCRRRMINSLVKKGILIRGTRKGFFSKMSDEDLMIYVADRFSGKTSSEVENEDITVYNVIRNRGIIKILKSRGILIQRKSKDRETICLLEALLEEGATS